MFTEITEFLALLSGIKDASIPTILVLLGFCSIFITFTKIINNESKKSALILGASSMVIGILLWSFNPVSNIDQENDKNSQFTRENQRLTKLEQKASIFDPAMFRLVEVQVRGSGNEEKCIKTVQDRFDDSPVSHVNKSPDTNSVYGVFGKTRFKIGCFSDHISFAIDGSNLGQVSRLKELFDEYLPSGIL